MVDDACVEWPGTRTVGGYGRVGSQYMHRFIWELVNGPIPDGLHVLHRCDNPPCVNPRHLFVGTAAENCADRDAKGRGRNELKARPGEYCGTSKLTDAAVRDIRARAVCRRGTGNRGGNLHALAKEFGVGYNAIYAVVRRMTWRHI